MNTNNDDKRLATLQARAALQGLELKRHGSSWELVYTVAGDIHLVLMAPTLDAIEREIRAHEPAGGRW